jgi:hypothetical protein
VYYGRISFRMPTTAHDLHIPGVNKTTRHITKQMEKEVVSSRRGEKK